MEEFAHAKTHRTSDLGNGACRDRDGCGSGWHRERTDTDEQPAGPGECAGRRTRHDDGTRSDRPGPNGPCAGRARARAAASWGTTPGSWSAASGSWGASSSSRGSAAAADPAVYDQRPTRRRPS